MLAAIRAKGFPWMIRELMLAPGKAEKERVAKRLRITGTTFQQLVVNCGIRGYTHRSKSLEHVPDHLQPSAAEFDAIEGPNPEASEVGRKFLRKLDARFKERRCPTVHLFEKGLDEWHIFCFAYEDALHDENHWEYGKHLHYIASDFGLRMTKDEVWAAFDKRKVSLPSLHIPFDLES